MKIDKIKTEIKNDNGIEKGIAKFKESEDVRRYILQRAELIGAIDLTGHYRIEKAQSSIQSALSGTTVQILGDTLVVSYKGKEDLVKISV